MMKSVLKVGEIPMLRGDFYIAQMCQEGGKRSAFISAEDVKNLKEWVDFMYVLLDINQATWFEISHPKLRGIGPGEMIAVVNGDLEEVDIRPIWKTDDEFIGMEDERMKFKSIRDEWYGPIIASIKENPVFSGRAAYLMHENGKRTVREQAFLEEEFGINQ